MEPKRSKRILDWEDRKVRAWVKSHRGILTRIAVECQVCQQFVSQIAYGTSTALSGHEVEKVLRREGWPGIRRKATPY
jgi:hypothetical protein